MTFRSALVPPYVRRTKTLEAALPWLYLKGISSGEMAPALKVLLGPDATGLSANTVSRLKRDWAKEYDGWKEADLDDEPIVYIWADGVHSGLRGENDKLCALVIVGRHGPWQETLPGNRGWGARVHAELARGSAQPQKPGNECAQTGHRRRCHGVLGRAGRSLSRDPPAAVLATQNDERAQLLAKAVGSVQNLSHIFHATASFGWFCS